MMSFKRFDVYQVNLDPVIGSEIAKSRPCVIVSPDEMNHHLATVIVAPLTSSVKGWPSRVPSRFGGKRGEIALDQLRAVDKRRLAKRLGELDEHVCAGVLATLAAMFAA
jgi:mRNA interferase MazF